MSSSPTFDYAQAARRHHADATLLLENQRTPNADHLFGFAAECALIGLIRSLPGTEHLFRPDGEAEERGEGKVHVRRHVDALWRNFWMLVDSHRGKTALRGIDRRENPFKDWKTNHRYFADAVCNKTEVVHKHRDAATSLLAALQVAETKKMKRTPSGGEPQEGSDAR